MTALADDRTTLGGRHGTVRGIVVVTSALVLAALPLFMVGGLAVQINEEFGLGEAAMGLGVTVGFVVGALSAPLGGRLADRIGPKASTYIGNTLTAISLLGLGLATEGWWTMVIFLCVAGVGVAVTDPGLAVLVNRAIPFGRQGLAFGIKEASIPASTLAAGLAVPAVALTVGWRWAFAIGLIPWAVVMLLLPSLRIGNGLDQHEETTPSTVRRTAILLAASGAALGTAAASGIGIYLTSSAVTMGLSPANAGFLLATGSIAGVVTRIAAGAVADRSGGPQFKLIAAMLAVGAVTMAMGGTGNTWLLVLGTIGTFTGGWAWSGLYFLSLVATNPQRAGSVAGIGILGLGIGNAIGPLLFGVVAQTFSFGMAWLGAAMVAGLAALLMAMARSRF